MKRKYTVGYRNCPSSGGTRTNRDVPPANTVNRLFDAQRQHRDASPIPSSGYPLSQSAVAVQHEKAQRSTLHAFWNIASRLPIQEDASMQIDDRPPPYSLSIARTVQLRCDDCDRSLQDERMMHLDEEFIASEVACWKCRRCVCDTCSIHADVRLCLGCAIGK